VRCIEATADEQFILTAGVDRIISVWDADSYKLATTLKGHDGRVLCLAVNASVAVSGSNDETMIIWDLESRKIKCQIEGAKSPVVCVAVSQDTSFIVSVCIDRSVRVWIRDKDKYDARVVVERHPESIHCLALSKKEK
jgi:F-box and WD-40 domain protein 1/11